jgi:hypothetical protein
MLSLELPGNSEAWSTVLGPVALASLASLLSLLGAVARWRRDGSLRWFILLVPLVVVTPMLTARDEKAGYLVMALLLQPLALWVLSPVLRNAVAKWLPPPHPPRELILKCALVAGLLPALWFASCTYACVGEVNQRIARLESVPAPPGAQLVEKDVALWRWDDGYDNIVYRAQLPPEEAEGEVRQRLQAEGWMGPLVGNRFSRGGDCVSVYAQACPLSAACGSSPEDTRTYLQVTLLPTGECRPPRYPPSEGPTQVPPEGPQNLEPFGIPLP